MPDLSPSSLLLSLAAIGGSSSEITMPAAYRWLHHMASILYDVIPYNVWIYGPLLGWWLFFFIRLRLKKRRSITDSVSRSFLFAVWLGVSVIMFVAYCDNSTNKVPDWVRMPADMLFPLFVLLPYAYVGVFLCRRRMGRPHHQ